MVTQRDHCMVTQRDHCMVVVRRRLMNIGRLAGAGVKEICNGSDQHI